jgi:hypothetical protein
MTFTKESLIDWMGSVDGKIVARITKEKGGYYAIFLRDELNGKMEHFTNATSFKEAKQVAEKSA